MNKITAEMYELQPKMDIDKKSLSNFKYRMIKIVDFSQNI